MRIKKLNHRRMFMTNPFELQQPQAPQQLPAQPQPPMFGGLAQLVPQDQQQLGMPPEGGFMGMAPSEGGSYFQLDPAVMSMMWRPQGQPQGMTQPLY